MFSVAKAWNLYTLTFTADFETSKNIEIDGFDIYLRHLNISSTFDGLHTLNGKYYILITIFSTKKIQITRYFSI